MCSRTVEIDWHCRRSPAINGMNGAHAPHPALQEQTPRRTHAGNSGPEEGIKGVVEDVKGKAKEAVGTVTGSDDLTEEGKAQQDKAEAQRDAAAKEAEAEKKARGEAKAQEKRQESHQ